MGSFPESNPNRTKEAQPCNDSVASSPNFCNCFRASNSNRPCASITPTATCAGSPAGASSWPCLFCQLGQAHSLREICGGLAATEGKLKHLGLSAAPKRSTLSYANRQRPWQLFETVFQQLLGKCRGQLGLTARGHKFRFKNRLLSLDASVIDLCVSVFDWAQFQRTKGAIKLHLLLDHAGYLPSFAVITTGKTHDLRVARQLEFEPGTVLVFDRGYIDYQWFVELSRRQVYFVTRLKEERGL